MHYINGREAKENDQVIVIPMFSYEKPLAGTIRLLNAQATTCNAQFVDTRGLPIMHLVTIANCIHAEDALAAWQAANPAPEAVPA